MHYTLTEDDFEDYTYDNNKDTNRKYFINQHGDVKSAAAIFCKLGDVDMLESLKIEDVNFEESLLLTIACEYGQLNVVKYLINNFKNSIIIHKKSLRYACKNGYNKIVKFLVDTYKEQVKNNSENIYAVCKHGFNWACTKNKYLEMVKYLVNVFTNTSNPKLFHNMYEKGLHTAISKNKIDIVKYLMKKFNNNNTSSYIPLKLHANNDDSFVWSVSKGNTETIKYLIKISNTLNSDYYDPFNIINIYNTIKEKTIYDYQYNFFYILKYSIEIANNINNDSYDINSAYDLCKSKLAPFNKEHLNIMKFLVKIFTVKDLPYYTSIIEKPVVIATVVTASESSDNDE